MKSSTRKPLAASAFRLLLLLAIPLCACLATAETVMVPMKDGVKLATGCYIPKGDGPFPAMLTRTVYGRTKFGKKASKHFLSRGIALIAQDTRGRGGSEGAFNGFEHDGWCGNQDAAATLAWIRAQTWCNGKVGTFGGSALGIAQVMAAGSDAEITCQDIVVASSTFYGQLSYQGGVFRKALCENWLRAQKSPHIIDLWKAHPHYDDFWECFNAETIADRVNAPALHVGGWWDIFAQGTINNFTTRQYNGGPNARGNQMLIMGPWLHGPKKEAGAVKFPRNFLAVNSSKMAAAFCGHWLLGKNKNFMNGPAVRYYTLGDFETPGAPGNEWRKANDWPPFPTKKTPFYLVEGGGLANSTPFPGQTTFIYDPADPCPTLGGQNLTIDAGPFDQRPVSSRPDVLCFSTPSLSAPLEVTGRVRARLFVSSDAPDTDFTAKLVDIYPDGKEIILLDSIRRLKFHKGFEQAQPVAPGTVVELDIDLWSTSIIFNKGHQIGLQVSSSNYPRFEKNPNTGEDLPKEGAPLQVARNTVYMSEARPSALILPVRP